jgi:hypothetical protein
MRVESTCYFPLPSGERLEAIGRQAADMCTYTTFTLCDLLSVPPAPPHTWLRLRIDVPCLVPSCLVASPCPMCRCLCSHQRGKPPGSPPPCSPLRPSPARSQALWDAVAPEVLALYQRLSDACVPGPHLDQLHQRALKHLLLAIIVAGAGTPSVFASRVPHPASAGGAQAPLSPHPPTPCPRRLLPPPHTYGCRPGFAPRRNSCAGGPLACSWRFGALHDTTCPSPAQLVANARGPIRLLLCVYVSCVCVFACARLCVVRCATGGG